jgi:hypothetical protein
MTITAIRPLPRTTLATLTRYETWRLARSPILVLALALTAYAIYDTTRGVVSDADELPTYPAGFLGGFGMIAACWLTQSMQRSAEALDVAPTPTRVRTAALCLTTLLPFGCGLISLAAIVALRRVDGPWTEGMFSSSDRAAVLVGQVVLPALGGPLLGIALGRWVRAGWVPPAVFAVNVGWELVANGLAATYRDSMPVLLMRMFAPFTFFTTSSDPGIETWRGSPTAFLAWQLCLCALAVIVAMLRHAERKMRQPLINALIVVIALTATSYALAVTGGVDQAVVTRPHMAPEPIGD